MANSLVKVPEATGIVDGVGTPRMETVPAKSIVEAAFTSALAVGLKPKTLQMFAMAPKVAERGEHACKGTVWARHRPCWLWTSVQA